MVLSNLQIFVYFILAISIPSLETAEDSDETKKECVNEIVEWCNGNIYQSRENLTVLSEGSYGSKTRKCYTSNNGTYCSINGDPLLSCSPTHEAKYKDQVLHKNSLKNIDGDVCYAAENLDILVRLRPIFEDKSRSSIVSEYLRLIKEEKGKNCLLPYPLCLP